MTTWRKSKSNVKHHARALSRNHLPLPVPASARAAFTAWKATLPARGSAAPAATFAAARQATQPTAFVAALPA